MKNWTNILSYVSIGVLCFTLGEMYQAYRYDDPLDKIKNTDKEYYESSKMQDSLFKILEKQMNIIEQLERQIKLKPDTTKSEDKTSTVLTKSSLKYYKRDIVS